MHLLNSMEEQALNDTSILIKHFERLISSFFLGGLILKLLEFGFEKFRQRNRRQEENVKKIQEYLDEFGRLSDLYSCFVYKEEDKGSYVKQYLQPDPIFKETIEAIEKMDINKLINQKIINIRLKATSILDIVDQIEQSHQKRQIAESMQELYQQTDLIKFNIEKTDFVGMYEALQKADIARKNIRLMLEKYLQ
jgi:hypothetical protein